MRLAGCMIGCRHLHPVEEDEHGGAEPQNHGRIPTAPANTNTTSSAAALAPATAAPSAAVVVGAADRSNSVPADEHNLHAVAHLEGGVAKAVQASKAAEGQSQP